jgi:hypothetical protein
MDESRMRTTVAVLLRTEASLRIQQRLQEFDAVLAKLEKAPGRRLTQYKTQTKLRSLGRTLQKCEVALTQNQRRNVVEIKGFQFFSHLMVSEITQLSLATPTAVRRLVGAIIVDRMKFLCALRILQDHYDAHEEYSVLSCATLVY